MPAAVMTEESKEEMRLRLEPEYEVYNYVLQRLYRQWQHCRATNKTRLKGES